MWINIKKFFTFSVAIDITSSCNLNCSHCYLENKNKNDDLDDGKWQKRIQELKKQYPLLMHAIWLWWEPFLKKWLLVKLMKNFRYNSIFTNWTVDFSSSLKNTVIQISIDWTEKIHDKIRWQWNFQKIIKNIKRYPEYKYTIAITINKENSHCLEEFIKYFYDFYPNILGIHFIFHTKLSENDNLYLDWKEKKAIWNILLNLKNKYKDFLLFTPHMINFIMNNKFKISNYCPFNKKYIISLDSKGLIKNPCWYGKNFCKYCWCSFAYEFSERNLFNFSSIKTMWKLFTNSL